MIGIIDYGSGNFASVCNAFNMLNKEILTITSKKDFPRCSHIVLPGVGSFGSAMDKLNKMDIIDTLNEYVNVKKINFLGICVGMQLLADVGYEFGEHAGLGYVHGSIEKLKIDKSDLPLPHMGWNNLIDQKNSPLFDGIAGDATFYFVHSYHLKTREDIKTVNTIYGKKIVAALSIENIHGVQFHPEKSQLNGLKLLENFTNL